MNLVRLVTLMLLVALAGCTSTQNGQALMSAPDNPVIFSLDSERVTAADFAARLDREIGEGVANLVAQGTTREQIEQMADEAGIRGQIFDQMVQEALLTRYARQHGIGVDAAAVDTGVLAAAAPALDGSFVAMTDQRVSSARNQQQLAVIARNTRAAMAHVRHILVADEAAADQVLADLSAGSDFAALASERSIDTASAADGGDLGWFPQGGNPPEFDQAAFSAPLNTPTKVIAQSGVHVIEVLERQDDRPFDSIEQLSRSPNAQQLYEQTFLPWYEELRSQAEKSGELQFAANFDPNNAPLPFPEGTP